MYVSWNRKTAYTIKTFCRKRERKKDYKNKPKILINTTLLDICCSMSSAKQAGSCLLSPMYQTAGQVGQHWCTTRKVISRTVQDQDHSRWQWIPRTYTVRVLIWGDEGQHSWETWHKDCWSTWTMKMMFGKGAVCREKFAWKRWKSREFCSGKMSLFNSPTRGEYRGGKDSEQFKNSGYYIWLCWENMYVTQTWRIPECLNHGQMFCRVCLGLLGNSMVALRGQLLQPEYITVFQKGAVQLPPSPSNPGWAACPCTNELY